MKPFNNQARQHVYVVIATALVTAVFLAAVLRTSAVSSARTEARAGTPGVPYANMPAFAPIGVRVDKYLDIPEFAKGPAIDPAKGYRTQSLGDGLYMITDGAYQSMFMTYEDGVVVVDAPPSYAVHIPKAIAEVTDKRITHVIYSHAHADHIAGVKRLGVTPNRECRLSRHRHAVSLLANLDRKGSRTRVRELANRLVARGDHLPLIFDLFHKGARTSAS